MHEEAGRGVPIDSGSPAGGKRPFGGRSRRYPPFRGHVWASGPRFRGHNWAAAGIRGGPYGAFQGMEALIL